MARRFRFHLETVERLRKQARDAQRRAVADAARAVGTIEERILRLTRQLSDTLDGARDTLRLGRLDLASLRGHELYRGWVHRRIAESYTELACRRSELDVERAKLVEASKQLKVIEKLRERRWRRHLVDVAREEQAASDEAAVQLYLRRRQKRERENAA